ncbi:pyridoxamine 5'-phosphate oxidase family protein [Aquincola sp. S2]|uniref:Pyridoxamine 5'-phosphate oxidase family protein n=1 Tax=Pseudaquabacterium terrae TaxID=2732868 RepID=A0ABX2EN58_9BURK|nr:pyridoxamine 5'-phosphate oxidase family protein [Aquabacterium terrae]NRF70125.1 pyridoxamine 5'-phosphate oxidase family protein [Aquabacterium terrae]
MNAAPDDAPFHAGEVALQARLGMHERLAQVGRNIIRDHMPEQHRELFEKLPTLLVGALDDDGQPWATMLHGATGFVRTPDAGTMTIAALPAAADPVAALIRSGAAVGLLGLEPHTRRRNRMNGRVLVADDRGFSVEVTQSFGNCPKYIQAREPERVERHAAPALTEGPSLSAAARALVTRADTLFIASASGARIGPARAEGVDVSHRGGLPGFVQIEDHDGACTLTLPDYSGNFLFNTLGNLQQWPRAGLLFIDHHSGDLLQIAVETRITHEGPALARWPGAQRLLHARVQRGVWRAGALPLRWTAPAFAPQFEAMAREFSGKPVQV